MWLGGGLADPYHEGTNPEEIGRREEVEEESKRETEAQSLHPVSSERCQETIYTTSKGVCGVSPSRVCGGRPAGNVGTTR